MLLAQRVREATPEEFIGQVVGLALLCAIGAYLIWRKRSHEAYLDSLRAAMRSSDVLVEDFALPQLGETCWHCGESAGGATRPVELRMMMAIPAGPSRVDALQLEVPICAEHGPEAASHWPRTLRLCGFLAFAACVIGGLFAGSEAPKRGFEVLGLGLGVGLWIGIYVWSTRLTDIRATLIDLDYGCCVVRLDRDRAARIQPELDAARDALVVGATDEDS